MITSFVGRFSGIVTYDDQTTGQFAVTVDEKGNYTVNSQQENNLNAFNLIIENSWILNILNPLLSPNSEIQFQMAPDYDYKTVTGFAGSISGIVTYDTGETQSFSSTWDSDKMIVSASDNADVVMDRIIVGEGTFAKLENILDEIWGENEAEIERDNSPPL